MITWCKECKTITSLLLKVFHLSEKKWFSVSKAEMNKIHSTWMKNVITEFNVILMLALKCPSITYISCHLTNVLVLQRSVWLPWKTFHIPKKEIYRMQIHILPTLHGMSFTIILSSLSLITNVIGNKRTTERTIIFIYKLHVKLLHKGCKLRKFH